MTSSTTPRRGCCATRSDSTTIRSPACALIPHLLEWTRATLALGSPLRSFRLCGAGRVGIERLLREGPDRLQLFQEVGVEILAPQGCLGEADDRCDRRAVAVAVGLDVGHVQRLPALNCSVEGVGARNWPARLRGAARDDYFSLWPRKRNAGPGASLGLTPSVPVPTLPG